MAELNELYEIAEENGIDVDSFKMKVVESVSIMDDDGNCFIAIDPDKLVSESDEQIKLAHELGHCLTGAFYNRYSSLDIRQKHERRAESWAIRNLLPEEDLKDAISSGICEIWDLAEHFSLPEEFIRKALSLYGIGN